MTATTRTTEHMAINSLGTEAYIIYNSTLK